MEKVREEIAKWLWCQEAGYTWSADAVDDCETQLAKESYGKKADQILSIEVHKGVTIEDLIKKGVKEKCQES